MTNSKTTKAVSFTSNHEPFGFLVQAQCPGKFMILRREDNGWIRVAAGFTCYFAAIEAADRMAEAQAA